MVGLTCISSSTGNGSHRRFHQPSFPSYEMPQFYTLPLTMILSFLFDWRKSLT